MTTAATKGATGANLKWKATKAERVLMRKIAERAAKLAEPRPLDRLSLVMDLEACHSNGCPLNLYRLLKSFPDFDFAHDVFGIMRYINRRTGKLTDHFVPRCSCGD